jgi:hypothetical protein
LQSAGQGAGGHQTVLNNLKGWGGGLLIAVRLNIFVNVCK